MDKINSVRENQSMEILLESGKKVIFKFDAEKLKEAEVSFDGGTTFIPAAVVDEVLKAFVEKHPEFAQ